MGGKLNPVPWNKGKHIKGHPHTKESKRKISEANKGKHHSEETKRKLSEINTGKRHSKETIKKLQIISTGRLHTKETKEKISSMKSGLDVPWCSKLVGQYTLSGKLLKVHKSGRRAAKSVNMSYTSIQDCCNNKIISVANYVWKYGPDLKDNIPSVKDIKRNSRGIKKKVNQYDLNDNFIRQWGSSVLAAKTLYPNNPKSMASGIRGVANSKCKTCGGFIWKYDK